MPVEEIVEFVKDKAAEFGARPPGHNRPSYVYRANLQAPFEDNEAYFGFAQPEEESRGAYHDFSFAVMPSNDDSNLPWFINICVGTLGFRNDYELATSPGLPRMFRRLIDDEGFCKTSFSDTETPLPDAIRNHPDLAHLIDTLDRYSKVFCAGQIVRYPFSDEGKAMISAFLAAYARIRNWPTNQSHRVAVENALNAFQPLPQNSEAEVTDLLWNRRFVVLEGAPGTGKTRLAKLMANQLAEPNFPAKVFFTQFHAETSYSDFIYGIRPNLEGSSVGYSSTDGVLTESIAYAIEHPEERVLLIIDEINRANLSNVLGPVFYLFEPGMDETAEIEFQITPSLRLSRLPENFFAIATMNSADRSLAVVDFALRRRFAWYRMEPVPIARPDFFGDEFHGISRIFEWHASHEELSLQPGQAYFLAQDQDQMNDRTRYELLPLIREYLQEGYLRSAKEDFNKFFLDKIGRGLYE